MSASTVGFAIVAFASTTADDLVVLITFYSLNMQNKELDKNLQEKNRNMYRIALGQIISYSIIVGISLLGLLLGNFLPEEYVALIGFIPLLLGLKGLWEYFFDKDDDNDQEEAPTESGTVSVLHSTEEVASGPSTIETSAKVESQEGGNEGTAAGVDEEEESNVLSRSFDKFFSLIGMNPLVQKVAIAGLIVGADNIAVYISLFAKLKEPGLVVVALIIFYILLIVYIVMAYYLVIKVPNVSIYIDRYASIGIPLLLIALGAFILSESIIFTGR